MNTTAATTPLIAIACILLAGGAWTDLRRHRIPNVIVGLLLLSGFVINGILAGWARLLHAIAGALIGLALFLPFYAFRHGMGAGDVKFMGAAGAVCGIFGAVLAVAVTLVIGLLLALVLPRLAIYTRLPLMVVRDNSAKIPYGIAIASGSIFSIYATGLAKPVAALFV